MASTRMLFTTWNYLDADPYADVQAATVWGPAGGWLETGTGENGFSLENLQNDFLVSAARTATLDPAKTVIHVDFDQPRLIQCPVLLGHSLSRQATVRVIGYDDYSRTLAHPGADTGPQPVWPRYVSSSILPFEAKNWWTGQPTKEDMARVNPSWFGLLGSPRYAKHWDIWFDDQTNDDGYFDVGKVMLSPIIQPSINFLYGSSFGWETSTTSTTSKGGITLYDPQPPYRVANLLLQHLKKDESYHTLLGMKSRLGLDRPFFACLDPGDIQYRQLLSFRCTFSAMAKMIWETVNKHSFDTITLREAL